MLLAKNLTFPITKLKTFSNYNKCLEFLLQNCFQNIFAAVFFMHEMISVSEIISIVLLFLIFCVFFITSLEKKNYLSLSEMP